MERSGTVLLARGVSIRVASTPETTESGHKIVGGTTMRRRIKTTLVGALLATMLLVPAAQAKNTPNPFITPDLPGCRGNINATINHDSGTQAHENDSKGPGYYFRPGGPADDPSTPGAGQDFKAALAGVRADFCG
jgi:hypothetical protein